MAKKIFGYANFQHSWVRLGCAFCDLRVRLAHPRRTHCACLVVFESGYFAVFTQILAWKVAKLALFGRRRIGCYCTLLGGFQPFQGFSPVPGVF